MILLGRLLLAASVLAGCATPVPTPPATPTPTSTPEVWPPAPSLATTQPSAAAGTMTLACEVPVVPGHCLQPVAWAIEQLPAGYPPIASLSIMDSNLCPTASPCVGPPHRGEWWAAFTLRDGSRLGMRVVEMMGNRTVESVGMDATPPPSAQPATGEFPLTCGGIADATCAGAAAGATDVVPNRPPRSVRVHPGRAPGHYVVTVTFEDGTRATAEVARANRDIGWAAVSSPAP